MTATASGADNVRQFNPRQSTHYAMSEEVQFELVQLFAALDTIADLAEGLPGEQGGEIEPRYYAPVFRTFASYGKRLMADAPRLRSLWPEAQSMTERPPLPNGLPIFVYSVKDFCLAVGIGKTKVYEMIADGRIKSGVLEGKRIIPVEEAERIINRALQATSA